MNFDKRLDRPDTLITVTESAGIVCSFVCSSQDAVEEQYCER
jgi:hypothetical protein